MTRSIEINDGDSMRSLVSYYDDTWLDYRLVWLNRENLAIHFGYYDERHRRHRAALGNMNRALAELANICASDRVLDAGCGIGGSAFWLAQHRGAQVVGITPVQSQIDRARALARARGLSQRVEFKREDYRSCSLADASVDVVWALESLCHAPIKEHAYREFARVLKPGGRLVIAEYVRAHRNLGPAHEQRLKEWLNSWMIPDIDTASEHRVAAEESGLVGFQMRDVTRHTRRSHWRLWVASFLGVPTDRVLRRFGLRNEVQKGNVVGSRRQYEALSSGDWFYGIITAQKPLPNPIG